MEWGEQAIKSFFNGGCDCLLDAAVEGLFNGNCDHVLDACGKGRRIHLILTNLAKTRENIIRAYCGDGYDSGVNQTSLCGTEKVISKAAIKGHGVVVSIGGATLLTKRLLTSCLPAKAILSPRLAA